MVHDVRQAEDRKDSEIGDHHGPEDVADLRRPARLDNEQADQDRDRDRDDQGLQLTLDNGKPLDGGQDGNCRCDHRVAVKKTSGENAEDHEGRSPALLRLKIARNQGQQRKRAPFTLVVGAHRDSDVFERHDHHQSPEDEAEDSENVKRVDRERMGAKEAFLHRVERRGPDVAIDDANGAEHQLGKGFAGSVVRWRAQFGREQIVRGDLVHDR